MTIALLDLFCGAGGAAMGYHRAGFDVVGVDIKPQPHYPFEFHQGDALEVLRILLSGGAWEDYVLSDFAVIHASPPCQAYSTINRFNLSRGRTASEPELVDDVRALLRLAGLPYVIENVPGSTIATTLVLCGSMFALRVRRHRLFESSHLIIMPPGPCRHGGHDFVGVYSDHPQVDRPHPDGYARKPRAATLEEAQEAMGMDWADWDGTRNAIPPAYTEWIGAQLLAQLSSPAGVQREKTQG